MMIPNRRVLPDEGRVEAFFFAIFLVSLIALLSYLGRRAWDIEQYGKPLEQSQK